MKTRVIYYLSIVVLICSCSMYDDKTDGDYPESSDGMGQPSSNGNIQAEPGVVTAGEWCDLDKWAFWDSLVRQNDIYATIEKWGMFSLNRIAVRVSSDGNPMVNESVSLKYQGETDWSAKTDNRGTAELFLTDQSKMIADTAALRLEVGGREYPAALFVNDSVNTIELTQSPVVSERIEIGLMVDAIGSMGDELEFLKEDLKDVISKIQNVASEAQIFTGKWYFIEMKGMNTLPMCHRLQAR